MKKRSITQERKVYAYPSPKYHRLLLNYCRDQELSKSDVICLALREFFDARNRSKLPELINAVSLTSR
jgi:hypothetical protein